MKINLNSSVFTEMNHQLDVAIQAVLREVYKKNFQSGDITLKLIIGSHTDFAQVPDGMGGVTNAPYEKPVFVHKINIALQKKSSLDGSYIAKGQMLEFNDGVFELRDVDKAQMEMEDFI